jgi:hypothetical protein
MARKIKEIAEEIKSDFLKNTTLQELYGLETGKGFDEQFSSVSIETILIYLFATASALLENLVEMRKNEIDQIVMRERYGYKGWYERMMKLFQYGDDINELEEKTYYTVNDEAKQIIKFAYCEEEKNGILLKVAKEDNDKEPVKLSDDERNAALAYINRVKPAGIIVELRSEESDKLDIDLSIRYNPLIFTEKVIMQNAVEEEIKRYLKSLQYNGSFVGMTMIDFIQAREGIEIAQIKNVSVYHAGWNADIITDQLSYTPQSGHLILNELNITVQ